MIERVEITGFRLLDDFHADLSPLTIVIGANASGKSTLLDFGRMIGGLLTFPIDAVIRFHGGAFCLSSSDSPSRQLSWRIVFRRPNQRNRWSEAPLPPGKSLAYEATISFGLDGVGSADRELLAFAEPEPGHSQSFKLLDAHRGRSMVYDFRSKKLVPFDVATSQAATSPNQPPTGEEGPDSITQPPTAPPEQGAMLRLAQMRFFNDYPQASWIRAMLAASAAYPGFNVGRMSRLRMEPSEIRPETVLQPDGENLGAVLHEIFTRHQYLSVAEEFRAFVRAAYPFVDYVTAETNYGQPPRILVRVIEAGMRRPMELWDLSDGMLRFFCLAAALLNPEPPPFIMIDEPEVGLHPRLLSVLADMIKSASERSQVLVTTHSPDLLNRFDIDQVAVMRRDGSKASWIRPDGRDSLRRLLEPLSTVTIGDLHRSGELEAEG